MSTEPTVTVAMAAKMCRITFEHAMELINTGVWRTVKVMEIITRIPLTEVETWNSTTGSTQAVKEWRRQFGRSGK